MGNGGGGGGGGSYMSIRHMPIDHDIKIKSASVQVLLRDDTSAEYEFEYEIEGTPSCKPHAYYWHIIPNKMSEIFGFRAWDTDGSLEASASEFDAGGNTKTEYKIKYRQEMKPGVATVLSFSFATRPSVIVASTALRSLLFYSDYLSYTVECDSFRYSVMPPKGYIFFKTSKSHLTPVVDQGGSNPHPRPIVLQFGPVSPRTPLPVHLALRTVRRVDPRRAAPVVASLISIYAGALVAVILSSGLLWIVTSTAFVFVVVALYYLFSIRLRSFGS